MHFHRWSVILTVAGISGGWFLTVLSGLYSVKEPFVVDAEIIYFGFPFPWFMATRSGWVSNPPWHYSFFWQGFFVDFTIYGLLTSAVVYLYFITIAVGRKTKQSNTTFFLLGIE